MGNLSPSASTMANLQNAKSKLQRAIDTGSILFWLQEHSPGCAHSYTKTEDGTACFARKGWEHAANTMQNDICIPAGVLDWSSEVHARMEYAQDTR